MTKKGLRQTLAKINIAPIILLGILAISIEIGLTYRIMSSEVEKEAKHLAKVLTQNLNDMYPGDYKQYENQNEILVVKGDTILNSNYTMIDSYQEATGADFSVFYGDMRILTTIRNKDGNRLVGTSANERIRQDVLVEESPKFYRNVEIDNVKYYSYYEPLYNSDGTCIGMVAVLMSSSHVTQLIIMQTLPTLLLTTIAIILAYIWVHHYSKKLTTTIQRLQEGLAETAKGNLSNTIAPDLLARTDELGEISHSIITMQKSLRKLVEHDALTGLHNRRYGQKKLDQLLKKQPSDENYISIALGDIDHFKQFNDEYGHACGDYVLGRISSILQSHIKNNGICIRWGGEEFLLILTKGTFKEHKTLLQELVTNVADTKFDYMDLELSVTITLGLVNSFGYSSSDEILKKADALLYQGKESGRNQLVSD